MADAGGVRRDDLEVIEGGLAPFQEAVALFVALEFEVAVDEEGGLASVGVDLNGVVDDEFDRLEGVDLVRVAAEVWSSHRRIAARSTTQGRR